MKMEERYLRRIAIILCLSFMVPNVVFSSPVKVYAAASYRLEVPASVTATSLNLRSDAGTTADKIGSMEKGTKVTIIGQKTVSGEIWYQLKTTLDGKSVTGYASAAYIKIPDNSGFYGAVTETSVTMKKQASAASADLTTSKGAKIALSKGREIWIIKETTAGSAKWFYIRVTVDGTKYYGYVPAASVKMTGTKVTQVTAPETTAPSASTINLSASVTSTTLNIRKTAGTTGTLIATLKNGTKLTILSEKMAGTEKWYEVSTAVNGKNITGYVSSVYTAISIGSGFYATVKPTVLTYKSTASTTAKNLTDKAGKTVTASKGTYVWVSGEKNVNGVKWFRVSKHADGTVYFGYVRATDVTIIGKTKTAAATPASTPTPTPTVTPAPTPTVTPTPVISGINLSASVTSTTLNIRKTAGTTGTLIAALKNGTKLTILSEKMAGTEKWYEVSTTVDEKNITGYVSSVYTAISVGSGFYAAVKPSVLTYKASASTDAKNLYDKAGKTVTASKGTYVWVSQEKTVNGEKWFRISRHADGTVYFGYVKAIDLTIIGKKKPAVTQVPTSTPTPAPTQTPTATPTPQTGSVDIAGYVSATALNIRNEAGTASTVITTLSQNQKLTVLSQVTINSEIWYQVKVTVSGKEVTGYVYSPYVRLTLSSPVSAKSSAANTNVYLSTSTGSSKVTVLAKDEKVNVISESNAYGVKWFKIQIKQQNSIITGYIPAENLILTGNQPAFSTTGLITPTVTVTPAPTAAATPTPTQKPTATPTPSQEIVNKPAVIKDATSLGMRESASYSASFVKDTSGYPLMLSTGMVITAVKTVYSENIIWMHIAYEHNGTVYQGYINKAYVEINESGSGVQIPTPGVSVDFETMLTQQGFPESYKPYLRKLHEQYPNWQFEAYQTNLSWDAVIKGESVVGKNLITNSKGIEWKSLEPGAYNYATDSFIVYDGSYWVTASKEAISYYMDPRNFLTADTIFQFEVLTYKPEFQSLSGVQNILRYTPFYNSSYTYTDASGIQQTISYAETFIKAAEYSNVSPYHLASRVKQEVVTGTTSLSNSVSGVVSGFEGLYNFYNIGAYHSTVAGGAIANGLKYAKNGSTSASLNAASLIPWNNRYRAIVGGGYIIGNSYINRGQDTIYLQKFNVTSTSTYSHQYMANVEAAAAEAKKVFAGYSHVDELPIVFSIPVYKNMPASAVSKPAAVSNPNNYLKSLTVKDEEGNTLELTPAFSILSTTDYAIVLNESYNSVSVSAVPVSTKASVTGTGNYTLVSGINKIELVVTAQNGTKRTYTVSVIKE